jgi:hypothetical protein
MEWFVQLVEVMVMAIAALIWFVRLESKVMYLEKKVDLLSQDHSEFKTKVYDQLTSIKESLAKIEGFLQGKTEH